MSGIRMISLAPTAVADGLTTSASPAGVGSPLGSCWPPGAICTTELRCSGYSIELAGSPGWARAYRPPAATWVTARYGAAAFTVMVGVLAALATGRPVVAGSSAAVGSSAAAARTASQRVLATDK